MGQNFITSLKRPFYLAGQNVQSITFLIGEQWTKIMLTGCPVDKEGSVVVALTPEQAREIARDLLGNADKDQLKIGRLMHGQ
jgi:hypothetical protein